MLYIPDHIVANEVYVVGAINGSLGTRLGGTAEPGGQCRVFDLEVFDCCPAISIN